MWASTLTVVVMAPRSSCFTSEAIHDITASQKRCSSVVFQRAGAGCHVRPWCARMPKEPLSRRRMHLTDSVTLQRVPGGVLDLG